VKIVGLVPTFQEGRLAWSAIGSLVSCCDHIAVFDGPVGVNAATGNPSVLPDPDPKLTVKRGAWESDAAKRTDMLRWAQNRRWVDEDTWIVWLDGDEVLVWGEYLPDMIERACEEGGADSPVGGVPIRLHELEGTTSLALGRVLSLWAVQEYLISISFVRLANGKTRTLGNVPVWNWRQGPMIVGEDGEIDPRCRPASPGEPQILHRSAWRSKERAVQRQSEAEQDAFERA
jgi:hypothetical protein